MRFEFGAARTAVVILFALAAALPGVAAAGFIEGQTVWTKAPATLRDNHDQRSQIIDQLAPNASLKLKAQMKDGFGRWWQGVTFNGATGWVLEKYLTDIAPAEGTADLPTAAMQAVAA